MLKDLINLVFPKLCFGCQEILLENENILCVNCLAHLPYTNQHKITDNAAYQKFYGRIPIEFVACFLYYSKKGKIQNLIHQLKYNNHPEISYYLGKMYALQLKETSLDLSFDAIIPTPLHLDKMKSRGYNQVAGFAEALAEVFKIPIENNILYKTKNIKSQTKKNLFERTSKTEEKFEVRLTDEYYGKHFLLIDDILTTGGTLESCGKKLLQIPNSKLSLLCLAYTL